MPPKKARKPPESPPVLRSSSGGEAPAVLRHLCFLLAPPAAQQGLHTVSTVSFGGKTRAKTPFKRAKSGEKAAKRHHEYLSGSAVAVAQPHIGQSAARHTVARQDGKSNEARCTKDDARGLTRAQLFFSFFKTLVGKEVAVELKNDVVLRGQLHSVDQYLNVKLTDLQVEDAERFPQLVRVAKTA
eukprot:scaffold7613_cov258-Pinguiococcus_pyrenoidosus.AAC.9